MNKLANNPQVIAAIDSLVPDFKQPVADIEARISTTRDNYGAYLNMLNSVVPDANAVTLYVVSRAIIKAGGNSAGVNSALKIIGATS